jgi:hypothetical protein
MIAMLVAAFTVKLREQTRIFPHEKPAASRVLSHIFARQFLPYHFAKCSTQPNKYDL